MRADPRVDREACGAQELLSGEPFGAADRAAVGKPATLDVARAACRAAPEITQALDFGQVLLVRGAFPIQGHAGRLIDEAVEDDFRAWRIVANREIE